MAVTEKHISILRDLLTGDFDRYNEKFDQMYLSAERAEYAPLVAAAFFTAVDRRFANRASRNDVVEFVSNLRAHRIQDPDEVDPNAAEQMILAVLGHGSIAKLDDHTKGKLYLILLVALIADEELDEKGIDEFMAKSRELAVQWAT